MQLKTQTISLEQSGFSAKEFGLDANNPAIIQILTEAIYNDPYAWPRELLANAKDAGGVVELHLPESLDPNWTIEDHGPGMDHEFMMSRYAIIFDSTKRDNDDNIGGFGHGRLSPLAYTDTFSVRSRFMHEGKVMEGNYVVFRGENKVPKIAPVSLSLSEVEQTGVLVTVPIANKDIPLITTRTKFYAQYLKDIPGVPSINYLFQSKTGAIRKAEDQSVPNAFKGVRVVVGGVPYPAPINVGAYPIDLFFEVQDLQPTLSRDAIQATDQATSLVKTRFDLFTKEFRDDIDQQISKEKTVYDKLIKYRQLYDATKDYNLRSYIFGGMAQPTHIKIKELLDQAKKDVAILDMDSNISSGRNEGMDNAERSFRSLSALRAFQLSGGKYTQAKIGSTLIGAEHDMNLNSFIHYDRLKNEVTSKVMFFGVRLPYINGQIKIIKEAMAAKLGEYRDKNPQHSSVTIHCILIQFQDEADAKAIVNYISPSLALHIIDDKSIRHKAKVYIPVTEILPAGYKRRAMSSDQFSKVDLTETVFVVRPTNIVETIFTSHMVKYSSGIVDVMRSDGLTIIVVPEKDKGFIPAGAQTFEDVYLKYVAKHYGYPYDVHKLDRAKNQYLQANSTSQIDSTLLSTLQQHPSYWQRISALTNPLVQNAVKFLNEVKNKTKSSSIDYRSLEYKLHEIQNFSDPKERVVLIDKAKLPAPIRDFPTQPSTDFSPIMDLNKAYPMLKYVTGYKYGGMTTEVFNDILSYLK